MIIEVIEDERTKLKSDEGKLLTNGVVIGATVWLGANDDKENWSEVEHDGIQDYQVTKRILSLEEDVESKENRIKELEDVLDAILDEEETLDESQGELPL